MSRIATLVLITLFTAAASAGDVVDLDKPGAIEQIQKTNPEHYKKIQQIMKGILSQPEDSVPQWLKISFDAKNGTYGPVVLTSYPPKRPLSFELDQVQYRAIITLTNFKVEAGPAK